MALNLYGKTNYEVETPLTIEYSRTAVVLKPASGSDITTQFQYVRHATKTYSYKGMTEQALKACMSAKQLMYTRRFMEWRFFARYWRCPFELNQAPESYLEPPPYMKCVATFNVQRTSDAPVYDLQIIVDETVTLYDTEDYAPNTASGIQHIEALFTTQTPYTGPRPIWTNYQGVLYYKSYAYEYDYDENVTTDTVVGE
jgi:hypothetical protein